MRIFLCLLVLGCLGLETADAQRRRPHRRGGPDHDAWAPAVVQFGVRGGYDFDEDVGSAGAQVRVPLIPQLLLVPSGDVFFSDRDSDTEWQLNADVIARPFELGGLYAGIGAAFMRRDFNFDGDDDVEAGFNLLAGLEGARLLDAQIRPFVEARWTDVEDYSPFRLVAGINVPVR